MLLRDQHRRAVEPLVAKLDDATADGADEMLVVRLVACRLEPAKALAEVALDHEPRSHHDIECAVNRRGADGRATRPQLALDLVGGDVPVTAQDDLGNRLPLRGDGQVMIAQVREKGFYGRGAVHGSTTSA